MMIKDRIEWDAGIPKPDNTSDRFALDPVLNKFSAAMRGGAAPEPTRQPGAAPDYVDFSAPQDEAARKYQRFGEDPAYAAYFAALARRYGELRGRSGFFAELDRDLVLCGRQASPLQHAARLSQANGGAQLYFKREDLGGSFGPLQLAVTAGALVAQRLGRKQLVTGVVRGRCALYTASIAARLGLTAVIFVNDDYLRTRSTDLARMKLMGARVHVVDAKSPHAQDPRRSALEYAIGHDQETFLVMGLEAAPQPYPQMQNDFSSVVGREAMRQLAAQATMTPQLLVARGSSSADALGFLTASLAHAALRLVCVQVRSELKGSPGRGQAGVDAHDPVRVALNEHQQRLAKGILSGQEYPSVSREHGKLQASGRIDYVEIDDAASRAAIASCARLEGYVPPIETAQVIAWALQEAAKLPADRALIVMVAEDAERGLWDVIRLFGEQP